MEDQAYVAAYNSSMAYQKPLCSHCGKAGHTVQKCFKLHGYPSGYKTYGSPQSKNHSQSKPFQPQAKYPPQATSQVQSQMSNVVATVCVDKDSRSYTSAPNVSHQLTSGGLNLNLQSFSPEQIKSLIAQFNTHVRVSEPQVPTSYASHSRATITEHGVMDSLSSSGTIPFHSINLTFENQTLCYKHPFLSTFASLLPFDAWIIDSGASGHVCSDLGMFDSFVPAASVTVTLPNGSKVPITHT